jgi:hypothetical protein
MFRFTGLALLIGFLIFMFAPHPGFAGIWLFPAVPIGLLLDFACWDVEW